MIHVSAFSRESPEPVGRKIRQVARRYMESLEAERVGLEKRIADLSRTLAETERHHREAHPDCTRTSSGAEADAYSSGDHSGS